MSNFTTKPEQKAELFQIASKMLEEDISNTFVVDAFNLAEKFEGAFDLMKLWAEEDSEERLEILADLQEEIDCWKESRNRVFSAPKINFVDFDKNINSILTYKKRLKEIVEQWGGISKLSRASGIPQPSLSRFFNSGSMPRNTTLYRIADALTEQREQESNGWRPPYTIEQILAALGHATDEDREVGGFWCDLITWSTV